MSHYRVDEAGAIVMDSHGLFELWYHGAQLDGIHINGDHEIDRYNEQCRLHGKDDQLINSNALPVLSLQQRATRWLIPDPYKAIDVEAFCLDLCQTAEQKQRVRDEMIKFKERDLLPMLQSLIYLVDTLRSANILWGVGRGSSVASYVLYLLGVHRINSMRYGLLIEEFLRD